MANPRPKPKPIEYTVNESCCGICTKSRNLKSDEPEPTRRVKRWKSRVI